MFDFIAKLPAGVLYSALAVVGAVVLGVVWVFSLTIIRGGRIKIKDVEIDAPESENKEGEKK